MSRQTIGSPAGMGIQASGMDTVGVISAEFQYERLRLRRFINIRRAAIERGIPIELLRYVAPLKAGDWFRFHKPYLGLTPATIEVSSYTLEDIDYGRIRSDQLGNLYNESFHSFMHFSGQRCNWLTDLMLEEARLRWDSLNGPLRLVAVQAWSDPVNSRYYELAGNVVHARELEAIEEAMSEQVASLVRMFLEQSPAKRRSISFEESAPEHNETPGDAFYRWPTASLDISIDLKIASLWILENGCADPRSVYTDVNNTREALQIWYAKRWNPERPKSTRVDRVGKPARSQD